MDSSIRTTPGLISRIERLRDDLIKRFENIVGAAAIEKTDRNATAALQYQLQVETAALVRAAEDLQALIRNLQEMWLFGQLNTIGEDKTQLKTDETAREVAELIRQLQSRSQTKSQTQAQADLDAEVKDEPTPVKEELMETGA